MINMNNNIQPTVTTKNNSATLGNSNSSNKVDDKGFSTIVEELQKGKEEEALDTSEDTGTKLSKASTSSGNVYGGQSTDRGTKIIQPGEDMDKNAFLRILSAQMANQDPTQPQDGTEYVSQFAQFAAMEQMSNLNTTMSEYSARSLISRGVMLNAYNSDGTPITGVVRSVSQSGSKILMGVEYMNDRGEYVIGEFEKDDITNVIDVQDNRLDYINNNMAMLVGSSMINKEIEFIVSSESSEDEVIDDEISSVEDSTTGDSTIEDSTEIEETKPSEDSDYTENEAELLENYGRASDQNYETRIGKVESVVVDNYMIKLRVRVETTDEIETITLDKVVRVDGEEYVE